MSAADVIYEVTQKMIADAHEQGRQQGLSESTEYAEECRSLLRQARCPNAPSCDGKGTIAHWGVDNSIDRQPCQWCHERDAALAKNPNHAGARRTEPSDAAPSGATEGSGPVWLGPDSVVSGNLATMQMGHEIGPICEHAWETEGIVTRCKKCRMVVDKATGRLMPSDRPNPVHAVVPGYGPDFDKWTETGAGSHSLAIAQIAEKASPSLAIVACLHLAFNAGRLLERRTSQVPLSDADRKAGIAFDNEGIREAMGESAQGPGNEV